MAARFGAALVNKTGLDRFASVQTPAKDSPETHQEEADGYDDYVFSDREPSKVVKETKIVNKVLTVRKSVNMDQYRVMKHLCHEFMTAGLSEYRSQQLHWNELYEEQVEDMIDLQKKMDELEETITKLKRSKPTTPSKRSRSS